MPEAPDPARLAALGLPGTLVDPVPGPSPDWSAVVRAADRDGLAGLVLTAAQQGCLDLPPLVHEQLVHAHGRAMVRVLLLERLLVQVVEVLDGSGVETRILKGSAVARLDYANPSLRPFGDVDVLVPSDRVDVAVATLERWGCRRRSTGLGAAFDHRWGKSVTMLSPDGLEIDLHRTLATGRFGAMVEVADLWGEPVPLDVAGTRLLALGPEARLLHAAYHATLGSVRQAGLPLRDVAEMALYGQWDAHRLRAMVRRWQGEIVLATAVRDAWRVLEIQDVTALSAWAHRYEPPADAARALERHRSPDATYGSQQLAAFAVLPWSQRVRLAAALALPDREFLASRGTTLPQHLALVLRRGLRRA